jgi:hypothetical protein
MINVLFLKELPMRSIKLLSHVGSDGILQLQVPTGLQDTDIEVMVIVQPVTPVEGVNTSEQRGWQAGFFEETFGSIPDLERPPQGDVQIREAFE